MIVAPHSLAVEEGVKVLRRGGNAVDAAVTAAFVQCVVGIGSCGIGGFGSFHVYLARNGEHKILDFHGRAGSRVTPNMWQDILVAEERTGYGYVVRGRVNDVGYKSITTPGTLMGLSQALGTYGTISLGDALTPAIGYAEKGFPFKAETSRSWAFRLTPSSQNMVDRLGTTEASKEIYLKDGRPRYPGENLAQKDLANTLKLVSEKGVEAFYKGEICQAMADDLEKNGSFVTRSDLENYRCTMSAPLCAEYRGYTIASNTPPGGGITLIQILKILEGYELSQYEWRGVGPGSAEYLHLFASALQASHTDRGEYVGDPEFVSIPVDWLLSEKHAAEWRERIDSGERLSIPRTQPREEPSTTHLSVIDSRGNAVSLTHSLGNSSGVVTPGLGFLYNNCMNCFNPEPGHPNSIAPGKARNSGISPSIMFKDGEPLIVVGAPGANRIIGAVAQVILNIIDHKMNPVEAVSAPRIDCEWLDTVDVSGRLPTYVTAELQNRGHKVVRSPYDWEQYALVQAILVDKERGRVLGASDPRGGGIALAQ